MAFVKNVDIDVNFIFSSFLAQVQLVYQHGMIMNYHVVAIACCVPIHLLTLLEGLVVATYTCHAVSFIIIVQNYTFHYCTQSILFQTNNHH